LILIVQSPYTVRQGQKSIGIGQHDQTNGWE
jgi:hypothetical protein